MADPRAGRRIAVADRGGVFATGPLTYALSYIFFLITLLTIYVGVALLAVCITLFRRDPPGRGLATVVFAAVLAVAVSAFSGVFVPVVIVSRISCLVLWVSPRCRAALSADRRTRLPGVVPAGTIAVAYSSRGSIVAVAGLIAVLTFGSEMGGGAMVGMFVWIAACVPTWMGYAKVKDGAAAGRTTLTAAMALVLRLMVVGGGAASILLGVALAGSVVVRLWAPPRSQEWLACRGAPQPDGAPLQYPQDRRPPIRWSSEDQ